MTRKYTGEERVTIMDTNILLENGTNELEVLEFTLAGNHYGINVAKIREILTYQPVTPIPNAHPSVEGIFMPRDTMISVINLRSCLGLPDIEHDGLFIITNFNKLNIAFHVDEVCGIHRLSWADIITPDATINIEESGAHKQKRRKYVRSHSENSEKTAADRISQKSSQSKVTQK